jgi:hypothetical protein
MPNATTCSSKLSRLDLTVRSPGKTFVYESSKEKHQAESRFPFLPNSPACASRARNAPVRRLNFGVARALMVMITNAIEDKTSTEHVPTGYSTPNGS